MRSAIPLCLVLLLTSGCVRRAPYDAFVHPDFDARRPPMLVLTVEEADPETVSEAARDSVYEAVGEALIEKDYVVQVPDEPPGPETGLARVVMLAEEPRLTAVLSVFDAKDMRLLRVEVEGKTARELAERLTRALPVK
ncbi:MAG: hypothetical protein ABFS86_11080 [Planctomycetota bacterium]